MKNGASHYRNSLRAGLRLGVAYQSARQSAGEKDQGIARGNALCGHYGVTRDLGPGGAFIETDAPPPVGSRLELAITAPSTWEPVPVNAVVRWVGRDEQTDALGFGARFEGLRGAAALALLQTLGAAQHPS